MSRIGKEPVKIPKGVKVQLTGRKLHVEGPKGKLDIEISPLMTVEVSADSITVKRSNDEKPTRSLHGTVRAHINNMVTGVTTGFKKELDIIGVGFKAQMKVKIWL